ncbi:hypothetical protein F5Y17DRAFT_446068 [Xylariaceae sp. FL0594]|nr:hypothetical protein F5Y17DRAFT_446068 [Xylariaceae sp. FL0594]
MASSPATPLSSLDSIALNTVAMASPTPTMQRLFHFQPESHDEMHGSSPIKSAPFDHPNLGDENTHKHERENGSPSKARHSRVLSGNGLSPLKILSAQASDIKSPERPSTTRSPKKLSPEKRFPVKVNNNNPTPLQKSTVSHHEITLEDVLEANKDLEPAVKIFEDEDTIMENADESTMFIMDGIEPDRAERGIDMEEDEQAGADDTMISTFSTFSAVPNMTMFDRIGHTPTKFANTGRISISRDRIDPSPQRTPRAPALRESGNTTNLLDFTDQLQGFSSRYAEQVSSLRGPSPAKLLAATTPKRRQANLIDFDIPPLPTPRSIPSVTPRELETLKSGFLSEISGLKASLSGKEAEVSSLKTAVADAEKRVGECMEELREVKAIKEALVEEQQSWEKRGRDMESVLRKVKEEIVRGQREREQLESKLEESEKRREAAEIMAQEAESKMAAMRAGKASADGASSSDATTGALPPANKSPEKSKAPGSREVEIAVEKVSRELHALYKSKHEAKIAALKKSYENRWSKKVQELEGKIEELGEENERLRAGHDARVDPNFNPNQSMMMDDEEREERKTQAVKDSTQIRELNAEIERLGAVVVSVQADNRELRQLLERERIEKGELVILAEEMMAMQQQQQSFSSNNKMDTTAPPPPTPAPRTSAPIHHRDVTATPAPAAIPTPAPMRTEDFRSSVNNRVSGLRAPASVKKTAASSGSSSRVGERKHLGGGLLPRPGSGIISSSSSSRSGIMSSIEKMGNYRGRGE